MLYETGGEGASRRLIIKEDLHQPRTLAEVIKAARKEFPRTPFDQLKLNVSCDAGYDENLGPTGDIIITKRES